MAKEITKEQAKAIAEVSGVELGEDITVEQAQLNVKAITTNLTANIFMTEFIDTLNLSENPFDIFNKQDAKYGKGVRYVSTGIIKSKQYASGKYTPTEMGCEDVPDFEDYSTSNFKSTFSIKFNELELLDYFKNAENFATFLNKIRATNADSYEVERLDYWLYFFGNTDVELPEYMKTEIDKTKTKIKNTKALGELKSMKDVFTAIVKEAWNMGAKGKSANKNYNIGFTNSTGEKVNKSVPSEDLILVISANDLIDLSKETANIYHQTFYQGENKFRAVIEADIPKGQAWLIDKETFRLHFKTSQTIGMLWLDGSYTIATHIFNYLGCFKWGNGIKLTYTITPPTAVAKAE